MATKNSMKHEWNSIQQASIFQTVRADEFPALIERLSAHEAHYGPGEVILWEGNEASEFGIVLRGRGHSLKQNASGKTVLLTLLEPGSEIGVLLAAVPGRRSPVTVQAESAMTVLFFPVERVLREDELARQYLRSVAEKALLLHDRIDCLLNTSVRGKIAACLQKAAQEQGTDWITLPMSRSAMADYINVERSALSRELSRMKRDGILDYYKNSFHILTDVSKV